MAAPDDISALFDQRLGSRIAQRDTSVFAPADAPVAVHEAIGQQLGWVDAPAAMTAHVGGLVALAAEIRQQGFREIYLLAVGGSRFSAEVVRNISTANPDGARLTIVDTTDERTIREITENLVPDLTLFVVVTQRGPAMEVTALEQHFWSVMSLVLAGETGQHFVAVTDADTPLARLAAERGYRRTILNLPDVGGCFAALSHAGLLPAALAGVDVTALLAGARRMAERCETDDATNPGLALGAFIAMQAFAGRDKLTVVLPPALTVLGPWIEQLLAHGTGHAERGVLPVVSETIGEPSEYARDRAFVVVQTPNASEIATAARRFETAGFPVYRIQTSLDTIGSECYRWEFATAAAAAVLDVNPFDMSDALDTQRCTEAQLEVRRASGAFRLQPGFIRERGYSRRESRQAPSLAPSRSAGRFVAILDYLPADARRAPVIARLRTAIRRRTRLATAYGVGARYLHSTARYFRSGPNSGTFLLLTSVDASATPVPGTDLTLSALKYAQALGDFDALVAAGRGVIHYHFDDPTADHAAELEKVVVGLW